MPHWVDCERLRLYCGTSAFSCFVCQVSIYPATGGGQTRRRGSEKTSRANQLDGKEVVGVSCGKGKDDTKTRRIRKIVWINVKLFAGVYVQLVIVKNVKISSSPYMFKHSERGEPIQLALKIRGIYGIRDTTNDKRNFEIANIRNPSLSIDPEEALTIAGQRKEPV